MPTMPGMKKGRSKKNLAAEKFTREEEIKDIAENLSTILSLLTTKPALCSSDEVSKSLETCAVRCEELRSLRELLIEDAASLVDSLQQIHQSFDRMDASFARVRQESIRVREIRRVLEELEPRVRAALEP